MAFNELSGSGHVCHYNTKNLSIYSRHFWPFDCPLALILLWPASSVNISPIVSLGTNGTMWTRKGQLKWTQKEAENQKMCFKWRCAPKQEEQKVGHRVSPRRFFFWTRRKGGGGLTTTQGVRAQVWNWWGGQMDPTLLFVFFLYISSSWGEESKETVRCLFYFFREEFFFFFWRGFNGQNRITIFILRPFRLSLSPVYKYTSRALTS